MPALSSITHGSTTPTAHTHLSEPKSVGWGAPAVAARQARETEEAQAEAKAAAEEAARAKRELAKQARGKSPPPAPRPKRGAAIQAKTAMAEAMRAMDVEPASATHNHVSGRFAVPPPQRQKRGAAMRAADLIADAVHDEDQEEEVDDSDDDEDLVTASGRPRRGTHFSYTEGFACQLCPSELP